MNGLSGMENLKVQHRCAGRVLHLCRDGTLYICRGPVIFSSGDWGGSWRRLTALPYSLPRRLASSFSLTKRLLRLELRALTPLSDGTLVAASRQGVFWGRAGDPVMRTSAVDEQGQRLYFPMSLTAGPGDRVLWGEYNSKIAHGRPIRLYVSDDRGRSYQVAHVFEPGSIMHLHNIVYDATLDHYWVLSGDFDQEAGIGCLSADLSHFEWFCKGRQHYRAVEVFDFGDRLVYGMDTQLEPNAVISFDKATGRVERLCETDGSCIYACLFGGLYVLTTSIEPSSVNRARDAGLWLSRDGDHWRRVFTARKDCWHMMYFQFGSLILPRGACDQETIAFSGQAVRDVGGQTVVATLNEG
jgi:hypothetical protein